MATYEDWKVGDLAVRKNRLCRVKKIHFDEYPPHVTVEMLDDHNEVGTEFSKLRHATSEEIESIEGEGTMNSCETRSHEKADDRSTNINGETGTNSDDGTITTVETKNTNMRNHASKPKINQRKTEAQTKNDANTQSKKTKMDVDHKIDDNDYHNDDINEKTNQHIEIHSSPSYKSPKTHLPKKKNNRRSETSKRDKFSFGFDPDDFLPIF